MPQTHVIRSTHQFYAILNDPSYHIGAIRICSEDVMEIVTTQAKEEAEKSLKTNVFIAIFMTAHARLKLYEALETLQERVLYYDTDLVIYKWRPGQAEIPLAVFLGELTLKLKATRFWNLPVGGG